MTSTQQFLTMTFVKSRTEEDDDGNLIRVETRKCDRTGLTVTGRFPVKASKEYLAAAE